MKAFGKLFGSTLGKKAVMAVTGVMLFGFVLVHMAGNLKLYLGAEAMNHYGEWLRTIGEPALPRGVALWIARLVLLVAVVLHIWAATALTLTSRAARPVGYARHEAMASSYAARTMRWGGVIVLLFVIYHLMDLTWGTVNPGFVHGKPYENVVASFSNPVVSAFYLLANVMLGFHLYHGLWSFFQTLGWNHPAWNRAYRGFATAFALIVTLGNFSFPIAVLTGVVR